MNIAGIASSTMAETPEVSRSIPLTACSTALRAGRAATPTGSIKGFMVSVLPRPAMKAVRRDTRREAELKSLSRAELLSLYRQQNAADPVMAALMIRLGKEDLDDIQAEAATCVRMLEIQAARERRTAA
jgi:hypothetical protein